VEHLLHRRPGLTRRHVVAAATVVAMLASTLVASGTSSAAASPGQPTVPAITVTTYGLEFDEQEVNVIRVLAQDQTSMIAALTVEGEPLFLYGAHDVPCEIRELEDVCLEEEHEQIYFGYAATPTAVRLTWTPAEIEDDVTYSILRDGAPVATLVNETEFLDMEVEEGVVHEYYIEAEVEDLRGPDPFYDESQELPDDSEAHDDVVWGFTIGAFVVIPEYGTGSPEDLADAMELQAEPYTAKNSSEFRYRTFISPSTAPGFPCKFTNGYFGGDGRSYSATSGTHRTRMRTWIDWGDKGRPYHFKVLSATKFYNNDGTLHSTKTASMDKMKFETIRRSSSRVEFKYDHSASNPYCPTKGAIRYVITVNVWKSGTWTTSGWRRKAPHHEAYVRKDTNSWRIVLRKKNEGFQCLNALMCKTQRLDASGTA
jgi:hypothetical protein